MTTPSLEAMGTAHVPRRGLGWMGPRGKCIVHGYPGEICGDRGCRGGGRSGDGRLGGGFQCRASSSLLQAAGVLWRAIGDGGSCFGVIRESAPVRDLHVNAVCLCLPWESEVKSPASRASIELPPNVPGQFINAGRSRLSVVSETKPLRSRWKHLAEGGTRIRGKLPVTHKLWREPSRLFPAPALQPQQSSSLGRLVPTVHFRRRMSVISVFARLRCRLLRSPEMSRLQRSRPGL